MLGAFEHQVLEQVRKAGAPGPLVLGADVVPDVDRHDRHVMILVDDDVEAVGERALGERKVDRTSMRSRCLPNRDERNLALVRFGGLVRGDRHLRRRALGHRQERPRGRRPRLADHQRHAACRCLRESADRSAAGRGTARPSPSPALRRRHGRRCRPRGGSSCTRSSSCSRRCRSAGC